eukprot:6490778-Amphidinium_carterae.1
MNGCLTLETLASSMTCSLCTVSKPKASGFAAMDIFPNHKWINDSFLNGNKVVLSNEVLSDSKFALFQVV